MGGAGTGTPVSGFAFVVETGEGLATANSYLSLAGADDYNLIFTGSTAWAAATMTAKQRALIQATQYLDNEFHARWRGYKANETQALDWPRISAETDDGYAIDSESLPTALQYACAEFALRVVLGTELHGQATASAEVVEETVKVGPIEETIKYSGTGQTVLSPSVRGKSLLKGLIQPAGLMYRG